MTNQIIILAGGFFIISLLFGELKNIVWLKWVSKSAASASFVLFAITSATPTLYSYLIIAALICCMAGDIFLLPRAKQSFLAGMGAFALGHLFYIFAFLNISYSFSFQHGLIGIFVMCASAFFLKYIWSHLNGFRTAVAIYSAIIAAMMVSSLGAAPAGFSPPYWPIVIGAFAFAVSDLSVAYDRFVTERFFNRLWGLPLYYAAQFLLAFSVRHGGHIMS